MPTWKPSADYGQGAQDYPMVPPGCRMYSPRRLKRYLGQTLKQQRLMRRRVADWEKQKVIDLAAKARRAEVRTRVRQEQSIIGRVKQAAGKLGSKLARWVGRGRKQ